MRIAPVRFFCCAFAALCLWQPAAHAGFEWAPPPHVAQPAPVTPPPSAAPAPAMMQGQDGPLVQAVPVTPVDEAALGTGGGSGVNLDMWPVGGVNAPAAAPRPQVEMRPENFAVAEGFGRDLPLATVLSQVVPEGYAYALDPGVDAGQVVSWNGGRPWNIVLQETLAPAHLRVSIADKTVRISRPGANGAPAALAQYSPPPSMRAGITASSLTPLPGEAAAAPAAASGAGGPYATGIWHAGSDSTLHAVLAAWCNQAGVRLLWDTRNDYRLPQDFTRQGTFADALEDLLALYKGTDQEPAGRLHAQTPDGMAVLVITGETITN